MYQTQMPSSMCRHAIKQNQLNKQQVHISAAVPTKTRDSSIREKLLQFKANTTKSRMELKIQLYIETVIGKILDYKLVYNWIPDSINWTKKGNTNVHSN